MTIMTAGLKTDSRGEYLPPSRGRIFGVPVGDFGVFASLLLSFSIGFLSFFAATFVAIFSIMIYNSAAHKTVNFADSYRLIGFPLGIAMLVVSLIFFGSMWVRRKLSGN